jgi:heme exporter protein CcmD
MGGYAAYVWSAFGLSIGALAALFVASWWGARKRATELERWRRRVESTEQG